MQTTTETGSRSVATDETDRLIASNKVEGTAVYNRKGERLGSVYNFMVDKRSGQVDLESARAHDLPVDDRALGEADRADVHGDGECAGQPGRRRFLAPAASAGRGNERCHERSCGRGERD